MADLTVGYAVRSLAGRDKGRFLVVRIIEEDGYVIVADGHERPLDNPKRKNPKHICATYIRVPDEALRGNRALHRFLRALNAPDSAQKEAKACPKTT